MYLRDESSCWSGGKSEQFGSYISLGNRWQGFQNPTLFWSVESAGLADGYMRYKRKGKRDVLSNLDEFVLLSY